MPRGLSAKLKKKIANENESILSFLVQSKPQKKIIPSFEICKNSKTPNLHLNISDGKMQPQARTNTKVRMQKHQSGGNRTCPRFKWVPDTSFTVDAFKYGIISGCTAYFLTHFHYDHYGGLSKGFTEGIYCSEITKKFLLQNFGCCLSVHALPMNTFVNVQGCDVMLLDANHCPGSVMILFRLVLQNKVILHTGDFRAQSWMLESPNVLNHYIQSPRPSSSARITTLLLDTTYCCPTYGFPTQDTVISAAVKVTREFLLSDPDTLVVCGMYSIGKERFVLGENTPLIPMFAILAHYLLDVYLLFLPSNDDYFDWSV
uniref:DNA cross-link repair 1A protein n=1 Tax=Schistocephalus solidus TaxID=70667 RepID=A0A0V0J1X7_SCHSO